MLFVSSLFFKVESGSWLRIRFILDSYDVRKTEGNVARLIICDNQIVKNFHFCNIIFFLWFYIEFTPANSIYILLIFVPKLYSLNLFKHSLIKISLLYRIFRIIIKTNLQSLLLTMKQPYQSYIDPRSKHAPSVQFLLQFLLSPSLKEEFGSSEGFKRSWWR